MNNKELLKYWSQRTAEFEQEEENSLVSYWEQRTAELEAEEERKKKAKIAAELSTKSAAEEKFAQKKQKETKSKSSAKSSEELEAISKSHSLAQSVGKINSGNVEEEEDGWFDFFDAGVFSKGSAFSDGFDWQDIPETLLDVGKGALATVGDVGLGVVKGIGNSVEGVLDTSAYASAWISELLGDDKSARENREFAAQNIVNETFYDAEKFLDDYSFLGSTSKNIAQGVGQVGLMLATGGAASAAGLGTAGTTAVTTGLMGLSGAGSGTSEAYQAGATDEEAATYGLISGAADAITEMIFGGLGKGVKAIGISKGLSSADDMFAKKVSGLFKNQIAKNISEFAIKAGAEGIEEVLAGIAQAAGKQATYMSEKEGWEGFWEILKDENLLEQFVVGAVTSGIAQSGGIITANKTGTDFITGYTANEQSVIDKVVENRVADAEQNGKKLSPKEKNKIYESVENDMKKGYIDTDTIESVLGGETYKTYKDTLDSENALTDEKNRLTDEFNTLNKMKQSDMTGEQMDRREELRTKIADLTKQIDEASKTSNRDQLKTQLSDEVSNLLRNERKGEGSHLLESYYEIERGRQAFQADTSKYEGIAKKSIESIIEKGQMRNTNRAHDIVDFAVKLAAARGKTVTTTTTEEMLAKAEQLHGKDYVIENFFKTVKDENGNEKLVLKSVPNAEIDGDTIALNVKSKAFMQTVIGHELAHTFEGDKKYYNKLAQLLNSFDKGVKGKEAYDAQKSAFDKRYENIAGANAQNELNAELLGEYVFSDEDFIKHLTQDRNVFQKIYDNIKYMLKYATAGSQQEKDLLRIKHTFEKAWREAEAANKAQGDTKFSLSDSAGKQLTSEQQEYFKDSVVRDENGNLKVMYHGTSRGGHTVFDTYGSNYGLFGTGSYFTDSKTIGESYTKKGKGSNPQVYEAYLNIKNPLDMDAQADPAEWTNAFPDADFPESGTNEDFFRAVEEYYDDGYYYRFDAEEEIRNGLEGMGYDGITHIGGGRVNADGERHQVYIAFQPEQIKNLDNVKPTSDPDIRFSLSEAVEESNDLMALHNLKGDELLKSLDLGGLPMPSIAVVKANAAHDQYGEISLILPKETIDPKANKDNKVYGGDAWTPTYPKIEYKPNDAVAKKISDKYYELYEKYGSEDARPLYNFTYDLENALNGYGGEAAMLEELYDSTRLMQAYLLDSGKGKVETVQKEIKTELSDAEVEMNDFFIKELGAEVVDDVMAKGDINPAKHRAEYWGTHGEKIKETYQKLLSEEYGFSQEEIDNVLSNMKIYDYLKFVRDAYLYRKNGRVTTKTEQDYQATEKAIREAAGEDYKAWVDNLFKGIEEKSGIRNNADYFTNSGNRRKWEALHWENTLENVVRVMKQQNQTGADAIFGAHQLFATAAKDYGSIAEIKADSHRLYKMSEEDYEAAKDSYSKRMMDIANKIMDKGERNQFIALDNAMECIVDAVRNSKTKAGIFKELKQYSQLNVTEQDVDDIVSLVTDISNMPTGYFEAKPMRAVGFDEVGVFVIPNNADIKLKQQLLNQGYAIAEYDPNIEGHRQQVVNSFEEYKFSLSDVGETPIGKGVRLRDLALDPGEDIAPVMQTAEKPVAETAQDMFPDDYAPMSEDESAAEERLASLDESVMPPEADPYYGEEEAAAPADPFKDRDIKEVGNRKVKAYMYENPEVKPYFQEEANIMLGELNDTVKGERIYNEEGGWTGTSRYTSDDIAYLRDSLGYTYAEIEKGLNAIIEDNGAENNAISKRIEFILNDRLADGYTDFRTGLGIPANTEYLNLLNEKQITDYSREAWDNLVDTADQYAPPTEKDIGPVVESAPAAEAYEAIRPQRQKAESLPMDDIAPIGDGVEYGDKLVRVDAERPGEKRRKWVGTSTESEAVKGKVLPDDLNQDTIHYQPISNKTTLGNANAKLNGMGYDASVQYFNSQFANRKVSLDDVALGERLIQEAIKRGDTKTAGEIIQNVAILGTELGQKVQALSIIKRLTPEGQLGMLQKVVERGKTKGDKAFEGVEFTQEMIDKILAAYGKDGTYDQKKLNKAVEDVKQQIADQMKVTKMDKVNAWRYLSMLGNPKTHIRNFMSNVAMKGTVAVKNAVARTIESIAPIENRTKTWQSATDAVKAFADQTTAEMKDILSDGGKYSESESIKEKRQIFKNKILNSLYEFNSDMLTKEDWWFSKPAFTSALSEYLTANGIRTEADIQNNPEVIEKAKQYATEQSQIATFRQYSWLANKINDIERHNTATNIAVGAVLPFKKTPINIAKTGLSYSPLGFAKTLTYDISQVKNGKMEASELIDHLSQNITGSALTLVGYMLASSGLLSGGGEDDKEGEYDYQLGEQSYAINIGGNSYSLSWLSPVAMPLFVGANAYEQLVEGKEWNGDVVVETLAQTLDPLSEMSFLSGLNQVLSSYDSGMQKFAGIGEAMAQNYATQFVPTLSSQIATVLDDTKRTTKVAGDSGFKFFDQTINKLKLKIPGLRETLEPSTDIWGNEVKQTEDVFTRAFETFIAPYSKKENIATEIDEEIKSLYSLTGDTGIIPNVPYNYVNYKDEKYEMSGSEFTEFKKTYGQTSYNLLSELFATSTYQTASAEEKADMVNRVYDYARDEAKRSFLAGKGLSYTNTTEGGVEVYKEDAIKGAIENDISLDEYSYSVKNPDKYKFLNDNNVSYSEYKALDDDTKEDYDAAYNWMKQYPAKYKVSQVVSSDYMSYWNIKQEIGDIKGVDADGDGKTDSGTKKANVAAYINDLDIDYGQKIILYRSLYSSAADKNNYNAEIVEYLDSRDDISYEEMVEILAELDMKVNGNTVTWD